MEHAPVSFSFVFREGSKLDGLTFLFGIFSVKNIGYHSRHYTMSKTGAMGKSSIGGRC